jgi:hypothetical protein
MKTLSEALTEYVAVRRALGTQLREPAVTLRHFVGFVERQGAACITTDLALRWAMAPVGVQRATWTRRLLTSGDLRPGCTRTTRARRSLLPESLPANGAGRSRTSLPIRKSRV